jgi:hypothetical protein
VVSNMLEPYEARVSRTVLRGGVTREGRSLPDHPGESAEPSGTDEQTFGRVFGGCDWAVMFILGRTGRTSARLSFSAGPGGSLALPVAVDWSVWPALAADEGRPWASRTAEWLEEFHGNIQPAGDPVLFDSRFPAGDLWDSADWAAGLGMGLELGLETGPASKDFAREPVNGRKEVR